MRKPTEAEYKFAVNAIENTKVSPREGWALNKILDVVEFGKDAPPVPADAWEIFDQMKR